MTIDRRTFFLGLLGLAAMKPTEPLFLGLNEMYWYDAFGKFSYMSGNLDATGGLSTMPVIFSARLFGKTYFVDGTQ